MSKKEKYDFVKDYKNRIEKILSKEVPYLIRVDYDERVGFFFNLSRPIELDTRHIEDILLANRLAILCVLGIGEGIYIISPDYDYILDELEGTSTEDEEGESTPEEEQQ